MFIHICLHLDEDVNPGSRTIESILWLKIIFCF